MRSLLPNINLLRHDFDLTNLSLIGVTETWLKSRIHDHLVNIKGFNIVRLDRSVNKRGGGLLIYLHDALDFERLPMEFNHSDKNLELLTILLKPKNQINFLVSLVYIPPAADRNVALDIISSLDFSGIKDYRKAVRIIAGDFNMEYRGGKKRNMDCQLLKTFESRLGLTQLINKPTRILKESASLIDLIFTSNTAVSNISESASMNYNISDHNIVWFNYKKETVSRPNVSFTFRSKNKYNLAVLLHKLENANWTQFYQATNPVQAWDCLYNVYLNTLNELAPYVSKKNVPFKDEWVNDSCLEQLKERDRLRGILRYCDDKNLYEQFKVARNLARQKINQARSTHIQSGLQEDRLSPKKYWKKLNYLCLGRKILQIVIHL